MNEIESDRLIQFIAQEQSKQRAFLAELIRVPSDNPPGDCMPIANRTRALLEQLGLEVKTYVVPLERVQANGMISATNLIVRERFRRGGLTIALNAHGDVVPPGLGWTRDPYGAEIDERSAVGPVMYGRGVAVSKSDFATYTWALLGLRHLRDQGVELHGTVELHFTFDEEAGGSIGPGWLLEQGLTRPDLAMCAGFSYGVTTAHNGCLHLEVIVKGKSGHAAIPHTGVDALKATTDILCALYSHRIELAARRSPIPGVGAATLNVGLIKGGTNTNVVPDRVSLRIDRRILPEESPEAAESELRKVVAGAVRDHAGVTLELRRILLANPLVPNPGANRLIGALQSRGEQMFGTPIPTNGVPLYTDARHYSAAGIPTILYGAGPRTLAEANGHAADECLNLSDLHRATCALGLALADVLQS